MKIYFHASLSQKDKYGMFYDRIIEKLKALGHEVRAKHVVRDRVKTLKIHLSHPDKADEYEDMMKRLQWADLVVFEIFFPSTIVVGHILTRALEKGKPVLGLYYEGSGSALLGGLDLERFIAASYGDKDLESIIEFEIGELVKMPDQRFTMLMPGDILGYLDKVAESGTSRSEFIRGLIRERMDKK